MQIRLDLIKPSPHPIRTSWDEAKMAELAQSIKEQGVIVPIKVRPVAELPVCGIHGIDSLVDDEHIYGEYSQRIGECTRCWRLADYIWPEPDNPDLEGPEPWEDTPVNPPFEIVYGHRRVEASRRAGLAEIPAIVEGVDDTDALVQALIENVIREDMSPVDRSRAVRFIKDETGWPNKKLGCQFGWSERRVGQILAVTSDPEIEAVVAESGFSLTTRHVDKVLPAMPSTADAAKVLRKAAQEELSSREVDKVADSYRAAQDDAERQAILETDYHDPAFDRLVRVKSEVKRERKRQERKKREEEPREVAQYLKTVQVFSDAVHEAVAVAEYGKFSPEATRFVKGWHDSVRGLLDKLEQAMEDHNAKVQEQGG